MTLGVKIHINVTKTVIHHLNAYNYHPTITPSGAQAKFTMTSRTVLSVINQVHIFNQDMRKSLTQHKSCSFDELLIKGSKD